MANLLPGRSWDTPRYPKGPTKAELDRWAKMRVDDDAIEAVLAGCVNALSPRALVALCAEVQASRAAGKERG